MMNKQLEAAMNQKQEEEARNQKLVEMASKGKVDPSSLAPEEIKALCDAVIAHFSKGPSWGTIPKVRG